MTIINRNKTVWLITGALAIFSAVLGATNPDIYSGVIDEKIIPGAFGQDLMTIVAALLLIWLAWLSKAYDYKKHILAFGIMGYLFYAYGLYAIERVYNPLYLVYLAIFALSFWGIIYGLATLKRPKLVVGNKARRFSIGIAIFQPLVFYPLWISALIPLMNAGNKIESYYSIYILDLVFIMPAFLILAVMLVKKTAFALYVTPAMFLLGLTLIFSLAVSEVAKLRFDLAPSSEGLVMSLVLSVLFLVATILHLKSLNEVR